MVKTKYNCYEKTDQYLGSSRNGDYINRIETL